MEVRFKTWREVAQLIEQMSDEQKDQLAAAGIHPDELAPIFALVPLQQENVLAFVSDGGMIYSEVAAGSLYLSTARVCRTCGCTELDCSGCMARTGGEPCSWVEPDLCSACATPTPAPAPAAPNLFGL